MFAKDELKNFAKAHNLDLTKLARFLAVPRTTIDWWNQGRSQPRPEREVIIRDKMDKLDYALRQGGFRPIKDRRGISAAIVPREP